MTCSSQLEPLYLPCCRPGQFIGELNPAWIFEGSQAVPDIVFEFFCQAICWFIARHENDICLTLGARSVVVKGRVAHCSISDVDQEMVAYRSGIEFIDPPERVY